MKRIFFRSEIMCAATVLWLTSVPSISAQTLTAGDLIVSVNEFTGSSTAPTYVAEYTTTGARTQVLFQVPQPGTTTVPSTDEARDLTFGPGNAVYLYNGTFDPYLLRYDPASQNYTQQTFEGWSTINNTTFGGLAQLGQFLYATDQETFGGGGDTARGIVRFDTLGGPTIRFAPEIGPLDLNVGLDGFLYALPGEALPNNAVFKYDPLTLSLVGTIPIAFADNRAVAVNLDGSIFVATGSGVITRYSQTGAVIDSLTVTNTFFSDIDISLTGRIALGTAQSGRIILTDVNLDSSTGFRATDSTAGGDVFVAWIEVPEPGVMTLLCLAALLACLNGWKFVVRKESTTK